MTFFFNDTATTEIYTLSLHDALPIYELVATHPGQHVAFPDVPAHAFGDHPQHLVAGFVTGGVVDPLEPVEVDDEQDRKSTRLNSSHANISHAVFCLKKKNSPIPYQFP